MSAEAQRAKEEGREDGNLRCNRVLLKVGLVVVDVVVVMVEVSMLMMVMMGDGYIWRIYHLIQVN